ncbi:MAG: hypothetical protein V4622_01775 [Bacteroidota bacterium]
MTKIANWIGIITGVLGIILSFYFYFETKEKHEISFTLDSNSYKIYDNSTSKVLQKISLYQDDTLKINADVYLVSFSIWNSGNMPIEKKDIRKDLCIKFKGINSVLDYRIIKQTDAEVSQFKFKQNKKSSSFRMDWKYFDPNEGLKIQILYTGKEILQIDFGGKILKTDFEKYVPMKEQKESKYLLILGPIALMLLSFLVFSIYKRGDNSFLNRKLNQPKFIKLAKVIVIILFIAYLILVPLTFYNYFFEGDNIPI